MAFESNTNYIVYDKRVQSRDMFEREYERKKGSSLGLINVGNIDLVFTFLGT